MKFTPLRAGTTVLAASALAVAGMIGLAPAASAAPIDITYDCEADTPLGPQNATLSQPVEATAPATVAPGGTLDVVVDPSPSTVPSEVAGYELKEVNTFTLKVPVPANSTLVDAELTGGSGLGDTPPEWAVADGIVTVTFPGPIAGGAAFELPTITAHLTAGESGAIESTLYGTSYDDPGLTFTALVAGPIGDIEAATSCFPNPNPVLTTTTIG